MRHRTGDDLAAMPTINSKMRIRRENEGIGQYFAHSYETCIGETHWHVGILLHQVQYGISLIVESENADHRASPHERRQRRSAVSCENVKSLGKNGLASFPWQKYLRCLC